MGGKFNGDVGSQKGKGRGGGGGCLLPERVCVCARVCAKRGLLISHSDLSAVAGGCSVKWSPLRVGEMSKMCPEWDICKRFSTLKGHCVVFGEEIQTQNFHVHNINEVIMQTQKHHLFP